MTTTPQSAESTAHTPGPWRIDAVPMSKTLYPTVVLTASDGRSLETVAHVSGPNYLANAALIAAAPETAKQRDELLAALKRIAESCREFTSDKTCDADPYDLMEAFLEDARAAIARSTGRAET